MYDSYESFKNKLEMKLISSYIYNMLTTLFSVLLNYIFHYKVGFFYFFIF